MSFYQMWLRLYIFNLAMIPVSIGLFFLQDKEAHLIGALIWCAGSFLGLAIRERVIRDNLHSE